MKMPGNSLKMWPNLEEMSRSHPIIPIVLGMHNSSTNSNLPYFINDWVKSAENSQVCLLHITVTRQLYTNLKTWISSTLQLTDIVG